MRLALTVSRSGVKEEVEEKKNQQRLPEIFI